MSISIHALLAESDASAWRANSRHTDFYPRSPCGERQCRVRRTAQPAAISIHVLLAESDARVTAGGGNRSISIHALLAESDVHDPAQRVVRIHISIHALLAESDSASFFSTAGCNRFLSTLSLRRATASSGTLPRGLRLFLSTLSLRRATATVGSGRNQRQDFYPRSPCGERRGAMKVRG